MTWAPAQLLLTESLKVITTELQESVAVLAGHSRTRSAGGVRLGGTVSLTNTSMVHEPGQLLLVTLSSRVKFWPHALPATTVTLWALVAPERTPLPEIDQE